MFAENMNLQSLKIDNSAAASSFPLWQGGPSLDGKTIEEYGSKEGNE